MEYDCPSDIGVRGDGCELSDTGFRGTAGGALSVSGGFAPIDVGSCPFRVLPRRGGGAGFVSMLVFVSPEAGTQSGSESGEKGLDLRWMLATSPSLGG